MDQNRDLIFGIFAVQLHKVTSAQIIDAGRKWTANPSVPLSKYLLDAGALSNDDNRFLSQLVEQTLVVHGGDSNAALQTLGGMPQAIRSFHGALSPKHPEWDPFSETVNMGGDEFDPQSLPPYYETPGRYEHKSEHARGGQGRLLIVHDDQVGRDVIMKELLGGHMKEGAATPTPVRQSASIVARFLQEAKITGQLEHPSIVPVYELGLRPDDTPYYTMKLLKGQTLAEILRTHKSLNERLSLIRPFGDMCHAIAYAHSRGVIHRDLKPHNVMVGKFGETVVLDWGLAKVLGQKDAQAEALQETLSRFKLGAEADQEKTFPGLVVGTPAYMAPEQAMGNLDAVDERSDVYSLGVILYEILAGRLPFPKDSASAILKRVALETPPDIATAAPDSPPELIAICRRCMHRTPAERYQSAADLARDIDNFLSGALVKAYSYSVFDLLHRAYTRNKPVFHTAAASLAILLAVAAYSYINVVASRDAAVAARAIADRERYGAQIRLVSESLDNNNYDLAKQTLAETDIAQRNWEWGVQYNRVYAPAFIVEGCIYATYSHDGTRIAAIRRAGEDYGIEIINARDGSKILSIADDTRELLGLAYSPDDSKLLSHCHDRFVRVWDANSGSLLHKFGPLSQPARFSLFDPTGSRITVCAEDGIVRVWDVPTGQLVESMPQQRSYVSWASYTADGSRIALVAKRPPSPQDNATEVADVSVWDTGVAQSRYTTQGTLASLNYAGTRLATAYMNGVTLHDLTTSQPITTYHGHTQPITSVMFSPDGARFAAASRDGRVSVFDGTSGNLLWLIRAGGSVGRIVFSKDGKLLATVQNFTDEIGIWDIDRRIQLNTFEGHNGTGMVFSAEFSPAGDAFLTGAIDSRVKAWRVREAIGRAQIAQAPMGTYDMDIAGDGNSMVTVSGKQIAQIWQLPDAQVQTRIASYNWLEHGGAAISADGSRLVLLADPFIATVWDLNAARLILHTTPHHGSIRSVALASDGNTVLTTGWDSSLAVWNAGTGDVLHVLTGHQGIVNCGVFSNDGKIAATADSTGMIRLWNLVDGTSVRTITTGNASVKNLAFNADATLLAAFSDGAGATIWDLATGKPADADLRNTRGAHRGVFTPDGLRLITAAFNRVGVADARSGRTLLELQPLQCYMGLHGPVGPEQVIYGAGYDGAIWAVSAASWSTATPTVSPIPRGNLAGPTGDPGKSVFVTHREALQANLVPLLTADVAAPDTLGPMIEGELVKNGAKLGFLAGDRFRTFNGNPLSQLRANANFATQALASLPEEGDAGVTVGIERDNQQLEVRFLLLPFRSLEVEVTLKRDEALSGLRDLAEQVRLFESVAYGGFDEFLTELGEIDVQPGEVRGIWIVEYPKVTPALHAFLAKTGLTPGSRITAINNAPLTLLAEVQSALDAAITAVDTQAPTTIVIQAERGGFERRNVTLRVE